MFAYRWLLNASTPAGPANAFLVLPRRVHHEFLRDIAAHRAATMRSLDCLRQAVPNVVCDCLLSQRRITFGQEMDCQSSIRNPISNVEGGVETMRNESTARESRLMDSRTSGVLAELPLSIKRILAPTDLTSEGREAIDYAVTFAAGSQPN